MNILLLTYSFNYNYGGLLQTYATVKYLQKEGHTVTVPVCHPKHMVGNTSLFRGIGLKSGNPVTSILRRLRQVKRYRRFDQLRKQLPLDMKLTSKEAIKENIEKFDVVLTGSDQTWNTKFMPRYDSYYYQGFIDGNFRKVSYAACFGTRDQQREILEQAKPDLSKFSEIAVRNETSRELVSQLIGVNPSVVVDPTLLYDFDEFRLESRNTKCAPFVMVYGLDPANFPVAERVVKEIRKRNPNIEIHFVNGEKNFGKPDWATHLINTFGPAEFLTAMQEATYVVTDSFHGVIFAQKFGRPCIPYTSGWRSERILGIVRDFSGADLLLTENDPEKVKEVVAKVADEGTRFIISDGLLQKIENSKAYLSSALGHS